MQVDTDYMPQFTWFYNLFIVGFGNKPPRTAIGMVFASLSLFFVVFAITLGPLLVRTVRGVIQEMNDRENRNTEEQRKAPGRATKLDLLFYFKPTGVPLAIAAVLAFVFLLLFVSLFYNYVCGQNVSVSYYAIIGHQLRRIIGVVGIILVLLAVWIYETGKRLFLSKDVCNAMMDALIFMVGKEKGYRVFSVLCVKLDSDVTTKTRRSLLSAAAKTASLDVAFGKDCLRSILQDLKSTGGLRSHGIDGRDKDLIEEVQSGL